MTEQTPAEAFDWDAVLGSEPGDPTPPVHPPCAPETIGGRHVDEVPLPTEPSAADSDGCLGAYVDPDEDTPEGRAFRAEEAERDATATELERSTAILDAVTAAELLDRLGEDPRALAETAANMRDTLLDVVRRRHGIRQGIRVAKLGDEGPASSTDVRLEAVGAANDADVLTALGGAFTAAAAEAKGIAGELLDELPGRGGKPRASFKVADGQGFELTVKRERRSELSVVHEQIDDVLAAATVASWDGNYPKIAGPEVIYGAGVRAGLAALREVLASSPTYRSTALDALAKRLENANEDELAKRLRKAYGKIEKGEPTIKLERKPLEEKGAEA